MKYNIKKSERTEAETLDHLLTVLKIKLEHCIDAENNLDFNLAKKQFRQAKVYLKKYIKELFVQIY